ncbi:XRE family transcriptional regulator [Campylobacter sp. RM16191]|uniref:XRE family transcriptional regulator n=1 Tax=Campylobacter sp. RM16191 TaxID=1705728 RepID=UPI0014731DC3|nr:XRE family transcriptional regulator [Campylobacter sp. RM16191]
MNREEFKDFLAKSNINKKELAELLNLPYGTVNNWGTSNPYPDWLKSWFENYIKAKSYEEIKNKVFDIESKSAQK